MPNFNTGAIPVILVDQNGNEKTSFPPGNTPVNPTAYIINSAATTNATSIKASGGNLYSITISNSAASPRYVKIYNKGSAPTVGTDFPVLVIPIAASSVYAIEFGVYGLRLGTGIALAITGAMADADTTAVGSAEVKVCLSFI